MISIICLLIIHLSVAGLQARKVPDFRKCLKNASGHYLAFQNEGLGVERQQLPDNIVLSLFLPSPERTLPQDEVFKQLKKRRI